MASQILVSVILTSTLSVSFPVTVRALFPRWSSVPGNRTRLRLTTLAVVTLALATEVYGRTRAPFGGGPLRFAVGSVRALVFLLFGALLVAVGAEIVGRVLQLARWSSRAIRHEAPPPVDVVESRREVLTQAATAGALAIAAPTFLRGGVWSRTDFAVHTVEIHVPGLPPSLEGLTLVQITDLHLGVFTGPREIGAVIDQVERLRGDLVVITGDILDHNPRHIGEAMRALARLKARGGVHAVVGNHDHYTGAGAVVRGLRAVGIRTHVNASMTIGPDGARGRGLVLAGVDDIMAPRLGTGVGPDLAAALRGRDPDDPVVLLAHNPMVFDDVEHRVALQLSGHTHGGQINAPGVTTRMLPYVAGLYRHGDATLFVSRGIGTTGPPLRINARPEVVRVALTGRPVRSG